MKHGAVVLILAVGLAGTAQAQVESASGAQVVYDPTTNTTRVTDPLFQPNVAPQQPVTLNNSPIHLHMPVHHVVHHAVAAAPPAEAPAVAEAAPEAPVETAPAPEPAAPPPPAPKVAKTAPKVAKAAPIAPVSPPQEMAPPSGPDAAIPFSMDSSTPELAPTKPSKAQRVASTQPASGQDGKHIRIIFTTGATEPTPETAASVSSVASNITNSLRTGSDRVLLQAYGGTTGDKSSEARRICLKRALSVRQLLIDAGIPSDRIDVRAMGGASLGDPPDRVDMIVHG